jgi:hypothetical protein
MDDTTAVGMLTAALTLAVRELAGFVRSRMGPNPDQMLDQVAALRELVRNCQAHITNSEIKTDHKVGHLDYRLGRIETRLDVANDRRPPTPRGDL